MALGGLLAGWALDGRMGAAAELPGSAGARILQAASVSGGDELSLEGMEASGAGASGAGALTVAGSVTVAGAPNTAVSLTFAMEPAGGAGPVLTAVTHDAGPTPATGPDGRLIVRMGAELRLPADEAGGNYAGTYRVIVHY